MSKDTPTAEDRVNRACYRVMTDDDLAAFRLWWEGDAMRTMLPPGPVDTNRLAMMQGDRERYLLVMQRAEAYRASIFKKEPT